MVGTMSKPVLMPVPDWLDGDQVRYLSARAYDFDEWLEIGEPWSLARWKALRQMMRLMDLCNAEQP